MPTLGVRKVKIFISQPMKDLTEEQIKTNRKKIEEQTIAAFKSLYPKEDVKITFLDTYYKDFNGSALEFLGKSIMDLSKADYAVFGQGWDGARGCKAEHEVCRLYNVPIIEL